MPEDSGLAAFRAATNVSRETLERLEAYADLLRKWAKRVNLVGESTLDDLWRRHIPEDARVLVDFGSGAGFPGLVLAIMGIAETHLIESNHRKGTFLREVARITGAPVTVHTARAEALSGWQADIVTARALAPLPILLEYAAPFVTPRTLCLFLKGRRVDDELTETQKGWNITYDIFSSLTDPEGSIVRLEATSRVHPH
ncbi:MAG: 16S rRNA (guanine(527)-N(7))-methyltransferase RsmG [Proteobacteria bacterium]|nr:16S rRNA (guanine(527)-N(7))-methyltransferase RsmG [Pseudomonadota bacterium]